MNYGDRLKQLREEKKLSQQQLADKLKLNRSTYARYELNKTQPDYDTLEKLANFFGVSTDYLLGRDDNRIKVGSQDITFTADEYKVFLELKKHPVLFHDLASDPEGKVKELLKLYKMKKILEEDDEDNKNGFGELED